jgi:hypothetical protein
MTQTIDCAFAGTTMTGSSQAGRLGALARFCT